MSITEYENIAKGFQRRALTWGFSNLETQSRNLLKVNIETLSTF